MKKFACLLLLALTTLLASAQNAGGPIKFLGIPIDGPRDVFATKLKSKGFVYNVRTECYKGQFNGQDVDVYIHTNHNLVDRVYVAFPSTTEENIRIEFNNLLRQFKKTGKYMDLSFNEEISNDDDISYNLILQNKRYQAAFSYFDPDKDFWELMAKDLPEQLKGVLSDDEINTWMNSLNALKGLSEEELASQSESLTNLFADFTNYTEEEAYKAVRLIFAIFEGMKTLADGEVWFMIHENYGRYYIGLYYDNLHNKANGEDL